MGTWVQEYSKLIIVQSCEPFLSFPSLLKLVSDKSQERRLGMSILNSLHRADGKRKTWNKPGR